MKTPKGWKIMERTDWYALILAVVLGVIMAWHHLD